MPVVAIPVLALWLVGAVLALTLARAAGQKVPAAAQRALSREDAA